MDYSVTVKFRNKNDATPTNKDIIIFILPPVYRTVNRQDLSDMEYGGQHIFSFKNKEVAIKFAQEIFDKHNSIFDVTKQF